MKFIPRSADHVPAEALFTPAGRSIYDREPGRFRARASLWCSTGIASCSRSSAVKAAP